MRCQKLYPQSYEGSQNIQIIDIDCKKVKKINQRNIEDEQNMQVRQEHSQKHNAT